MPLEHRYSSSNSIEDSAYVPLAENDQCVAPSMNNKSSKEEKDGVDEDDFVKVPVRTYSIISLTSTLISLSKVRE